MIKAEAKLREQAMQHCKGGCGAKYVKLLVEYLEERTSSITYCPEDPEGHTFNDNSGMCVLCGWTDNEILND